MFAVYLDHVRLIRAAERTLIESIAIVVFQVFFIFTIKGGTFELKKPKVPECNIRKDVITLSINKKTIVDDLWAEVDSKMQGLQEIGEGRQ